MGELHLQTKKHYMHVVPEELQLTAKEVHDAWTRLLSEVLLMTTTVIASCEYDINLCKAVNQSYYFKFWIVWILNLTLSLSRTEPQCAASKLNSLIIGGARLKLSPLSVRLSRLNHQVAYFILFYLVWMSNRQCQCQVNVKLSIVSQIQIANYNI